MVEAMLWDADGVLQETPGGWVAHFRPLLGDRVEEFLEDAWDVERPTLSGDGSWLELLPTVLERWDLTENLDDVLAIWLLMEAAPDTFALLEAVRSSGVRCYLATNQDSHRGAHMHRQFDYGRRFDGCYYSHALGVAKPAPEFFGRILADLGLEPGGVLFVDDNEANVRTAREVGLLAEQWSIGDGIEGLQKRLARHGVLAPD